MSDSVEWTKLSTKEQTDILESISSAIKNDPNLADLKLKLASQEREIYAGVDHPNNNLQARMVLTSLANPLPLSKKPLVDNFVQKLDTEFKLKGQYIKNLEFGLVKGDDAIDFYAMDVVTGNQVSSVLTQFPEQVLFIDFWATWCGPCQRPMMHNVQVIKRKSAEWKDKATIVCLSLDDSVEELKETLENRLWITQGLAHYMLPGGFSNQTARDYGVNGIPHCLLIDKKGKLVWMGHPMEIDLEKCIEQLINGEEPTIAPQEAEHDHHHHGSSDKTVDFAKIDRSAVIPTLKEKINQFQGLLFVTITSLNATAEGVKTTASIIFAGEIPEESEDNLEKLMEYVRANVDSEPDTDLSFFKSPGFPDYSDSCQQCNKDLKELGRYVSLQDGHTVCDDCEKNVAKDSPDRRTHVFARVTAKVAPNRAVRWGTDNVHPIEEADNMLLNGAEAPMEHIHDGVSCDGCSGHIEGFRFKCLNATDCDLCESCFTKWDKSEDGVIDTQDDIAFQRVIFGLKFHQMKLTSSVVDTITIMTTNTETIVIMTTNMVKIATTIMTTVIITTIMVDTFTDQTVITKLFYYTRLFFCFFFLDWFILLGVTYSNRGTN